MMPTTIDAKPATEKRRKLLAYAGLPAPSAAPAPVSSPARVVRVLFVTEGNACCGPMAEAFANAFGSDILWAESAGVRPAGRISALARKVMAEKQVSVPAARPRNIGEFPIAQFDLLVNLTGESLPATEVPALRYSLCEPEGRSESDFRQTRDRVEGLVSHLVSQLRDVCRPYHIGTAA